MFRQVIAGAVISLCLSGMLFAQDTAEPVAIEQPSIREREVAQMPHLFDVNGSYGRPSTGASDYPTIADRLAHMDRIGIERSLIWNTEAGVQGHSLTCNQRTLDEIARTPGASGRIIPAMIISGMITYERGGVDRLTMQLREGSTRALRFLSSGRLTLMQCEPVVRTLQDIKPFILISWDQTDKRDILDFTETFPDVPVILTDVASKDSAAAIDLMRQRKNILIDTSMWHTWNNVRTVVATFGAERVLFGTGGRSQNDAVIKALANAGFPDDKLQLIIHGNLERLTGLPAGGKAVALPDMKTPPAQQLPEQQAQKASSLKTGPQHMPSLFDANGSTGNPADCPTIADRLAHMDRLGIERSLVWNAAVRQGSLLAANQQLLDEIAATPAAQGRIIPALVISATIAGENGGIVRLTEQMRAGGTGALRYVRSGRGNLMQCGPIVRAARELRPFILVRWGETNDYDILDFAEAFPDVPVILTDVMWTGGIGSLDLMRRRPNVLIEISWWHTWDGVCLLVNHFGAERVLFGTGYISHNGAAIGALARAEVSDEDCAKISHGNLDRLTGLSPMNEFADISKGGILWQRYLANEPLGVDIVDAHGHLGPIGEFVLENQFEVAQIPDVIDTMDRIGERTMIISGLAALMGPPVEGNEFLHDLLKPHASHMSIYAVFNPFYADELVPKLDEWFADPQFVGFKTHCSSWQVKVTDPRFDPMWEYANRHRLPVLIHSWDDQWCSPAMTRDIVRKYPDLRLLVAHAGGGDRGRHEVEELAAEFPNVIVEWCGSFTATRRWEETLKIVPPAQVVYGTDADGHGVDWELGRLLSLDVPEETVTAILGANMRTILARRR